MINLKETILTNCIIHKVGNKVRGEEMKTSKTEIVLNEELEVQLKNYFLKPFGIVNDAYKFRHDIDVKMNEVFVSCDNIFEDKSLVDNSINIAKHLFNQTRNAAIKSGELFIAQFENIQFEKVICSGVGIFKSEKKDNFFKISDSNKNIELLVENGINQQKLDKGCLILNTDYHNGFKVFTYEYNGADTDYWRNDFLGIEILKDNYFQTKNFLALCKNFVTDRLPGEFDVSKAEQIDLLNKSVEFFKENKDFKGNDFVKEVFEQPEIIKSFKKFKNDYIEEHELEIEDSFNINSQAVKKQAKVFKSILKLDKNFHVYIHGDKNLIEKGYDSKKGLNFYKIYFNEER